MWYSNARWISSFAFLLLFGCASADRAQIADGVTTVMALSQGYTEGNPFLHGLSGWEILGIKIVATQAVKYTPDPVCAPGLMALTVVGSTAAFWNIGLMLGSGPAALPVALGVTIWQWESWNQDAQKTCQETTWE